MGQYDFTYEFPETFDNHVVQILRQDSRNPRLAIAFHNCKYEYEDLGFAYYVGLKGDNWNKHALDFTIEGRRSDISILQAGRVALMDAMTKGLHSSVSGYLIRKIFFLVNEDTIFPSTDEERLNVDIATANIVLSDLIKISERLSTNSTYNKETSENSINDFIRDGFLLMGYNEVKDQTRHCISSIGKESGEVDILISRDGKEIAIFEGLKLNSVDSARIDKHILKAIVNYNALGTATFIVAYVSNRDYKAFWKRYIEYIKGYYYPLQIKRPLEINASPNAAVRIADMILSRDGYDFPVYFMTININ